MEKKDALLCKQLVKLKFIDGDGLKSLDINDLHELRDLCGQIMKEAETLLAQWDAKLQQTKPSIEIKNDILR